LQRSPEGVERFARAREPLEGSATAGVRAVPSRPHVPARVRVVERVLPAFEMRVRARTVREQHAAQFVVGGVFKALRVALDGA